MANLDRDFYLDKHGLQSFVGELETNIVADKYSSSTTYAVGDYCIYENLLYRCTTAISSGESWNSSHWVQILIMGELIDLSKDATTTTPGLMSASDKVKLNGIESGAEVNVQSDWNATSGDALILNKPIIPAAQVNSDWSASSGVSEILNKPTTLSGYGITDANISSGTITLGSNTITPLTQHQSVTDNNPSLTWGTKSKVATIGSTEINVTMPTNPDTNTTYTFVDGTNGFTVTPSDGTTQTVTVTPDLQLEGTASGSIVSFNDGGDNIPVKSLVAEIVASQSGSGTPSPSNPRAISGFDNVEIVRSGKNFWDEQWEVGTINDTTGRPVSSTTQIRSKNFCSCKGGATYYICVGTNNDIRVCWYDKAQNYISQTSNISNATATAPVNAFFFKIRSTNAYGSEYKNDIGINYPSTATTYEPYKGITVTIPFGDTYYGGVLDLVNNTLTVTHGILDMGSVIWTRVQVNDTYYVFYYAASDKAENFNFICSCYNAVEKVRSSLSNLEIGTYNSSNAMNRFTVRDDSYTDSNTFQTAMTGQKIVYELAIPVIINLTPTQISTLSGHNNIYADCGNIQLLEYFTQNANAINDIAESNMRVALNTYEKSATGSIVNFSDGGDNIPLKSLVANITAVQSGSGTPSPSNPRAITGWTQAQITKTGKNLCPYLEQGQISQTTGEEVPSDTVRRSGFIRVEEGQTYAFSNLSNSSTQTNKRLRVFYYDRWKTYIDNETTPLYDTSVNATIPSGVGYIRFQASGTVLTETNAQVEKGSTPTFYEAYKGITTVIPFGDTYYVGVLDVTNGTLTVTHGYIEYDGSSDEVWYYSENGSGKRRVFIIITNCKPSASNIIANWLTYYDEGAGYPNVNTMQVNGNATPSLLIGVDSSITQASDWTTYLSTHTLQVVYELATPVVINFTKTQVSTLLNKNNIYADSGDISLEYFTQSAKNISDIANSSNKMDFSNPTGTGSLSLNRASGSTVGTNSVAVGNGNTASGESSFAEGRANTASGNYSHAEGAANAASGDYSHAEGSGTTASNTSSHAEGDTSVASGDNGSHAEGYHTTAEGRNSHSEGRYTISNHRSQHVFGEYNIADTSSSVKTARGTYVEIVGKGADDSNRSNARTLDWNGNETLAGDLTINGSTSVGSTLNTKMDKANPTGSGSLSIGRTGTTGSQSVAAGYNVEASGARAVALGHATKATADNGSFAEGYSTKASGVYGSHAEGRATTASGTNGSHAEGYESTASGSVSHAEGRATTASGTYSHAENINTKASGDRSHCEGYQTEATRRSQHVFGEFNIKDTQGADGTAKGTYIEIVGNGTNNENRSNARTLDWNGNETIAGDLTIKGNVSVGDAITLNTSGTASRRITDITVIRSKIVNFNGIKFFNATIRADADVSGATGILDVSTGFGASGQQSLLVTASTGGTIQAYISGSIITIINAASLVSGTVYYIIGWYV